MATQAITRGAHHERGELGEFLFRVRTHFADRPIVILEVGCGSGGALYAWRQLAGHGGRVIGVEQADPMGPRLEAHGATVIAGDPADPGVRRRVVALVEAAGGFVDLLVIDGVGTLEAVRADWWSYGPLVRPSGIAAIVGIVRDTGPRVLWYSMVDSGSWPAHRTYEIGDDTDPASVGIGYVIL